MRRGRIAAIATMATPTLEGEYWLMHNGDTQDGARISDRDAPLPASSLLHWDPSLGYRVR